jgi:NADPH:quinone reductase-like Zn-dependent oxidoreductase
MKAVAFAEFGGPEVMEVVELPDPEPGPGQVRIKVAAATINPTDILLRSGGRPGVLTSAPPYVTGLELAGFVDAVGEGVDWAPGDAVMAMTTAVPEGRGAQAELVVTDARSLARRPEAVSAVEAATVPMNGMTARLAVDRAGLRPGARLLVAGAAGAVGGYVTQLAAGEGIEVIAVARAGDEDEVRTLGATHFVAAGDDLEAAVRDLAPEGVDAAVDTARLGESVLPAVRDGGRLIAVRPFEGTSARGIAVDQVQVREYLLERDKLQGLADAVGSGSLTPRVGKTFKAAEAMAAYRVAEEGRGLRGRVVLDFA